MIEPRVIAEVRARIEQYRGRRLDEQNTKATLIAPVLRALGWNTEDVDEVHLEYRTRSSHNPVDYALLLTRQPRLFIEAKALGEDLKDGKWALQIISYAAAAGVPWVVLTDGDSWHIYNTLAPVPIEEKLFRQVRLSDSANEAERSLQLLSKEQMHDNALDTQWELHYVDRQVSVVLRALFREVDQSLVNLLRRRLPKLTPATLRASLTRLRIELDFPAEVATVLPAPRRVTPKLSVIRPPREPRRIRAGAPSPTGGPLGRPATKAPWLHFTIKDLLQGGLLRPGDGLELSYKGTRLTATVNLDGSITCQDRAYTSISTAAIDGYRSLGTVRKSENGWRVWRARSPDGALVPLDDLRRRLFERTSQDSRSRA